MIINISDSFNSMLQSIMFIYVSNYCSKTKRSILSIVTWIVILWGVIQGITLIVGRLYIYPFNNINFWSHNI